MTTCSIVIPVYNSESTLNELVERLGSVLPSTSDQFEVILVNDGSQDKSWQVISNLAQNRPWLHGINLMRNYGQHNALLCGVRAAKNEIIITMDDDLQHPPEEIPKLLKEITKGYDVVYGIPEELPHSLWRNVSSRLTKRILAFVMGIPTVKDIGAFRAFRAELRKAFDSYQSPHVILDVLLSWATSNFGTTPVSEVPRKVGKSNYNFYKLMTQAIFILTGFSTAPLRIASLVGFAVTLFGLIIFFYVLGIYFIAGSIPGFPFLASIISIFSGTQLFTLGIIGEYLARIFDRSMERPQYVIRNYDQSDKHL